MGSNTSTEAFNETANSTNNIAMSQAIQSTAQKKPSRMDIVPTQ